MINIPRKTVPPLNKNTISSLNHQSTPPITKSTVLSLNTKKAASSGSVGNSVQSHTQSHIQSHAVPRQTQQAVPVIRDMVVPQLLRPLRKGQKTPVDPQNRGIRKIKACFGWNIKDARCDMDASAFLITGNGRVPDDRWFVFYGQTESPDHSVFFSNDTSQKDREIIGIDFEKLNRGIQRIVFVLTINEAFEQRLNFSMIRDAYIRLVDGNTNQEIVSYQLDEYYENVTSMTIGELYLHNGQWKFNPVGSGVRQDLAGQCAIYGVEIC